MDHAEWPTSTNPGSMIVFLTGRRLSDRKFRLFALACARRAAPIYGHLPGFQRAIDMAERLAEGQVRPSHEARDMLHRYLTYAFDEANNGFTAALSTAHSASTWAGEAARKAAAAAGTTDPIALQAAEMIATVLEQKKQADSLRCIVGNPMEDLPPLPTEWLTWNGGCVRSLAESIYQEHAFDRMPILADALEEAGCTDAELLDHCRGPGPHTRGCWVVDWILGKA
jgi:hypothetical protein